MSALEKWDVEMLAKQAIAYSVQCSDEELEDSTPNVNFASKTDTVLFLVSILQHAEDVAKALDERVGGI